MKPEELIDDVDREILRIEFEQEVNLLKVRKWLEFIVAFSLFFKKYFMDDDGKIKKPKFWKWPGIIIGIIALGSKLKF